MNRFLESLPWTLLRSTAAVSLVAVVAALALRWSNVRSPRVHRIVAVLVLSQAWIVAPLTIALPWLEAAPIVASSVAQHQDLAADESPLAADAREGRSIGDVSALPATVAPVVSPKRSVDVFALLIPVWAIGMALIAGLYAVAYGVFVARADSRPATGDDALFWQATCRRTGARACPPLFWTDTIGPMLCLFPRGYRVLFPTTLWASLASDERDAVARHELSHWRRGDVWKGWLVRALALPQWFNPAAWWAVRRFDEAGEWLCDADVAGDSRAAKHSYLRTLLRLVEHHASGESEFASLAVGRCAHAHPLLTRVRRLTSSEPVEDSLMKRMVFTVGALALAACGWVRLELVARAADPPAAVQTVKTEIDTLQKKIEGLKAEAERLKAVGESLKSTVEAAHDEVNRLKENPAQVSDEMKRRVRLFETRKEADQLAALDDLDKLSKIERTAALGQAARDTDFESVRRKCLSSACALGDDGIPAIALAYNGLNNTDKKFLVEKLASDASDTAVILLAHMTKDADDDLVASLIGSKLAPSRKLALVALVADSRKDDANFVAAILDWTEQNQGDEGLIILYATAKDGPDAVAARAVRIASKRADKGLPVIAAGFQNKKVESRKAVVQAAQAIGGETGKFIIDTALNEGDAELKAAAEEAVKG